MSQLFNFIASFFESEGDKNIGVVEIKEEPTNLIPEVRPIPNWPKGLKIRVKDDKYLTPEGRKAVKNGILEIDKVPSL